ncbi:hypothetical protein KY284_026786 [Solanum tuberosum]|nr:hypothetical protein KY284_026786 [Solanum tuberosum]
MNSPVLGAPTSGKPLILYIALQERSLGVLLAQENEAKKEQTLYYLSRTLIGAELNYTPIEKMCLTLFYAIKKLRHYFEAYTIKLISRVDPVKFVMTRPVLSVRLAKWSILFNQYEIIYTPQKAVKGQALANFLTDRPLPGKWETSDDFPDEDAFFTEEFLAWTMFYDGSARRDGVGAGVVLISPERLILPFSFVLGETCSNNAAEYQASIVGLEMASDMKIPQLDIYGDSQLIINQLLGNYEVKKEDLLSYHQYVNFLLERFDQVFLNHVPRDALANLATTMALRENETTKVRVCHRWVIPSCLDLQINESHYIYVRVVEKEDWRKPLIEYLEHERLPEDPRVRADIKRRAPRFIFHEGILFHRSYDGLFLRCLDKEEVQQTLEEAYFGTCGAHQSGYGIPRCIVTDNGTPFNNKLISSLCEKFSFKQHKSSMYNAPANGLDEAFNKTLEIQEGLTTEGNAQLRLAELEALDEKRLEAQQRLECYQARLARAFNKKVRPRSFQVGDLVLAVRRPIILNKRISDKFTSKWDGSYAVREAYSSGAYKIVDQDGVRVGPINSKFLKQYFP